MVFTIILGGTFKTPMSPHRVGFTRSYAHRELIKKRSSNALVPTKTWLPNRVYIFDTANSPTLCSSQTGLFIPLIPSQGTSRRIIQIVSIPSYTSSKQDQISKSQ